MGYLQFLIILGVVCLLLALVSAWQIAIGKFSGFGPELMGFGLPFGAFIWGDLFVFAAFWSLASVFLYWVRDPRYFWVVFFAFWLVRSSGEALFWFIQQFHPEEKPWPQYFLRYGFLKQLSDKEWWVLAQVSWQMVSVGSLVGLVWQVVELVKGR